MITDKQLGLLRHTLGDVTCYRNHFHADAGHADEPDLLVLVSLGYLDKHGCYYYATVKGIKAAWAGIKSCYTCKYHLAGFNDGEGVVDTCLKVKSISTLHQFPFKKTTCQRWTQE